MTVPVERTRAVVYAHAFLKDLLNPSITPRVPKDVRETAKWLLRHYPDPGTVNYAHNLCPVRSIARADALAIVCTTRKTESQEMTVPFERTRALVQTKEFLAAMLDPMQTPRVPRWMRGKAKSLLKHYPGLAEIEMAHKALPDEYARA
jgi:hypothetical protein